MTQPCVMDNDTTLVHGQQLFEVVSRSNIAVRSYGFDTDFGYVCTDVDLGDMTLGKGTGG